MHFASNLVVLPNLLVRQPWHEMPCAGGRIVLHSVESAESLELFLSCQEHHCLDSGTFLQGRPASKLQRVWRSR